MVFITHACLHLYHIPYIIHKEAPLNILKHQIVDTKHIKKTKKKKHICCGCGFAAAFTTKEENLKHLKTTV